MSSSTLRILGYVAPALSAFAVADSAEAGLLGSALSSFGHSSPVQTVQFGGSNCYYAEGWNGRGWYQCGSEWNYGFGWIGPFNLNTFGASASRRHHRHGAVVSYPRALNPVYPRLEPPRRLGARGAPAFHTFGAVPGLHRFGAGGVPTAPNIRAGAATVFPSFAGGGFRGGLGGGNFHHFHGAGIPHTGAPVSPGFGGGGFHGPGGAGGFHGVPPARISARRPRRVLSAAGSMGWAGREDSTASPPTRISARRPRQALLAAAGCAGLARREDSTAFPAFRTSARQPRPVLLAAEDIADPAPLREPGHAPFRPGAGRAAPQAGSSSANTLTSATTSEPSAISAILVKRKAASAPGLDLSCGARTKRLKTASAIMIPTMPSFASRSAR